MCSDVPPDLKAAVLTRIQQLRIDVEHARFESLTITVRRTVGGIRRPGRASGVTGIESGTAGIAATPTSGDRGRWGCDVNG